MGVFVFLGLMILVFLVMGAFLLAGKGSFLISGYNTATPEEKAQYDEKKLCRSVGVVSIIIAIMLGGMAFFGYRVDKGLMEERQMLPFAFVFIGVVVTAVIVEIVYSNTCCKKKQ